MLRLKTTLLAFLLLFVAAAAQAAPLDFNLGDFGTQATFDKFVEEVGTLSAYRAMAPAEPEGWDGFDIGVAVSAVKINSSLWDLVTIGNSYKDYVYVPSVRVRKGLPFNLDVGASYTGIPDNDVCLLGGEVQWAFLEGGVAEPALALRGHYSKLLYVNDLDLEAYGGEAVISKGFAMFTPYAGVGAVYAKGEYTGDPLLQSITLNSHSFAATRVFAGVRMTIGLLEVTADVDVIENPVYSLKAGLIW